MDNKFDMSNRGGILDFYCPRDVDATPISPPYILKLDKSVIIHLSEKFVISVVQSVCVGGPPPTQDKF